MTLEERIVRLERQNGRMKCAAVALVGLLLTVGQSKPQNHIKADMIEADMIKARNFVLVDEKGEVRGGLGSGEEGPTLTLLEKGGVGRAWLSSGKLYLSGNEPRIKLNGEELGSILINVDPYMRGPQLKLSSKSGKAAMHVTPTLGSQLFLEKLPDSSAAVLLSADKAGAKLTIHDKKMGIVAIGSERQSTPDMFAGPYVHLVDSNEKTLFMAPKP